MSASVEIILLNEENIEIIKQLLKLLNDKPEANEFKYPVDYESLGLLDYPTVVLEPMDLKTLTTNLDDNKYDTINAFLDDLQKIWDNCKLYNVEFSKIHKHAVKLEVFCKKYIKEKFPKITEYGLSNHSYIEYKNQQALFKYEQLDNKS